MKDDSPASGNWMRTAAPYLDLGLRFALSIVLSAGGGYWLDSKFKTLPLFLIIGLLLGATSGFLTVYRAVYTEKKKDSEQSD